MKQTNHKNQIIPMIHGGDIYSQEIDLDFSVNTNPCTDDVFSNVIFCESNIDEFPVQRQKEELVQEALPKPCEDLAAILQAAAIKGLQMAGRYPDLSYRKLAGAIAGLEQVRPEQIVCGSGASELFMAIAHAVRPKKALVLAPGYSGYAHALAAAGCQVAENPLKEENGFVPDEQLLLDLTPDLDVFFLAHPNNPTGRLVETELLQEVAAVCEKKNILLVLDACFYPLASDVPINLPEALIVKAFTKTMSIPGLRLGYLISKNPELTEKIRRQLPEWNLSTVAIETGTAAAQYLKRTDLMALSRDYIKKERDYLAGELRALGITVYPSDTNYLLAKSEADLYGKLLEKKILIRDCSSFTGLGPDYVRFAVRTAKQNETLIEALKNIL